MPIQKSMRGWGGETMEFSGFDWDGGNRTKCQKHGVPVAEIESLFHHPLMVAPDLAHSSRKERFKAVGTTDAGRHVFIAFTLRRGGARARSSGP
jgi:uncharacterized DUF497 family protein